MVTLAQQVLTVYGTDGRCLDFGQLQAEVQRDQAWLTWLEQQHHTLRLRTVRPLYRAVHPSRNLETLKGVGQDSAAVYASFIGDPLIRPSMPASCVLADLLQRLVRRRQSHVQQRERPSRIVQLRTALHDETTRLVELAGGAVLLVHIHR